MSDSFSDKLGGITKEPNPLELIGLSPAILQLGLSDDELYAQCEQFARGLAARVHPDKIKKETEAARRFSAVLDLLKKREVFDRAIAEFRQWSVYLQPGERALISQKEELEKKLRRAEEEAAGENSFSRWAQDYLVGRAIRIAFDQIDKNILTVISLGLSFVPISDVPTQNGLDKAKVLYDRAAKNSFGKIALGDARGGIRSNFLDTETIGRLIERAKISGWRAPLIRWNFDVAACELGFPRAASCRAPMLQETAVLNDSASERYRMIFDQISKELGSMRVVSLFFAPEKIALPDDRFITGDAVDGNTLFLLGSVDLQTGLWFLKQRAESSVGRTVELRPVVSSEIIRHIEPFILPGRMIVSILALDPLKLQTKDAASIWQHIMKRRNMAMSRCHFFLSHVVL
ncbi:MAG: hypothetical protein ABIG29_03115 [Candidatus Nealsonbacteria bacterium]